MAKMITPEMQRINQKLTNKDGTHKDFSFAYDSWIRFKRNKTAVIGLVLVIIILLVALFAPLICPYDYAATDYMNANQKPNAQHWFGTDNLGRDLFSRCIYGTRISVPIGIASMIFGCLTGGLLGIIAAFFGGIIDNIIMRIMDVLQAIPGTLLAIVIVAVLGNGIPQLLAALLISSMPMMAKTFRAAIFTVRNSDYIESCRSIGANNLRLMMRHALPNAVGHIIIFAVSTIPSTIMIITSLSYIGLGITPPTPEWGALLAAGKDYFSSYSYMILFPGLMIMITVLAFNLVGDGLRDALDPRLK